MSALGHIAVYAGLTGAGFFTALLLVAWGGIDERTASEGRKLTAGWLAWLGLCSVCVSALCVVTYGVLAVIGA